MRITRPGRLALAGLLLAAGTLVAPATPAAAVPGLVYRFQLGATFDSTATKSTVARCPAGTRVLGGGGSITNGSKYVHLTRMQPSGTDNTYTVTATERAPYGTSWRVNAHAICAPAPAGLEYVSFHTFTDSDTMKEADAACTGSKKLVGLGARVDGGNGQVFLDDVKPFGPLTSAKAVAYEASNGYEGSWHMWSYAVCANPLPGLEVKWATTDTPMDSEDDTVTVPCPANKRVHGVGGLITGATGEASFQAMHPWSTLEAATVITSEEPNGYLGNWWSEVFVICAT